MHRGSARATLFNALGELVHPQEAPVPTRALLAVMRESGCEHLAARQAITRCAQAGWIEGTRHGRESWWTLTAEGRRLVEDGIRRVEALGRPAADWDGRWLVVLTSVPHDVRSVRQRLYRSLSWAGFGCPAPGVWLSPYPRRRSGAQRVIERLDLTAHTLAFIGPAADVGLTDADIVARAWALSELDELYAALVERFAGCRPGNDQEGVRAAPNQNSRLAAARLLELREAWLPLAHSFWRSLESDPAADRGTGHETSKIARARVK
jgi:phenylacetic acid degradation operon negative regulatory protein